MVYVIDRIDKKGISLNICSLNGTSGAKGGKCLFACCPFFPLFRERPCTSTCTIQYINVKLFDRGDAPLTNLTMIHTCAAVPYKVQYTTTRKIGGDVGGGGGGGGANPLLFFKIITESVQVAKKRRL